MIPAETRISVTKFTVEDCKDNIFKFKNRNGEIMSENRSMGYAHELSKLIREETVSFFGQKDLTKFYKFQQTLKEMVPDIFSVCEAEDFNGSFLLKWKGQTDLDPVLFMNHHDVVEAPGKWNHEPFSGEISYGKLWGRGTLDDKGGLYCMLKAADELVKEGFVPQRDTYFVSACTEEIDGSGCDAISSTLAQRGLRFFMCLDEGGMIVSEPVAGAKGLFAMIGVGEKGTADLKFIARSNGGHASTPEKDTPLVRLGKFMSEFEKKEIFDVQLSDVVAEMFKRLAPSMTGPLKKILSNPELFKPLLVKVMPSVSSTAGAMLKTTLAFTMAQGSEGTNVLPQEAWVVGNMRFSNHQGQKESFKAITEFAKKFDIETEILDPGFESPVSDFRSEAFRKVCDGVNEIFPGVRTAPFITNTASDSRYMSRVTENCIRFSPFIINNEQLSGIHGLDENVDIDGLSDAVDFYKYMIQSL